ncbi:MAG: hypothetical protein GOVbin1678_15 [Prokaryotic dsDNA virus sp.]|jgi:hypothetical protein|nr:MAG: hypothetical protein GOVbin1678_15 [Prokaryotic dsDNA virus sp.]|tara:strand:- start:9221 stop:9496 length:276 start_codon:yes stop_codon:yes gene_type:complete
MPKINTYGLPINVSVTDKLIGTDVLGAPSDQTKNFTVQSIINLVGSATLTLPAYNDDAAAGAAGLTAGKLFQTTGAGAAPLNAAGIVMIKQ